VGNRRMGLIRRWALPISAALALAYFPARLNAQAKSPTDSDCLACHGQENLKSDSGRSLFVDATRHKASVHSILGCTDCHTDIKGFPHPARIATVSCATCHTQEAAAIPKSVHAMLRADRCTACHGSAHNEQPAAALVPRVCASCHGDEVKAFLSGIHGEATRKGDPEAPSCQSCHGPIHSLLTVQDPASPVAKKNLPDTCAACHCSPGFLAKHQIPFAHPVEMYKASVHGRAVAGGNDHAATCSDCHGSHAIFEARDPRSKVNHWNVPATCGTCHSEIAKTYTASVHGQAVANGATDAPICTDCHGEHVILRPSQAESPVNPARLSFVTCGRCHGNTQLEARYNLPANRVPTFADSYHGLAARAGSQTVANCASCHGVHNIFPASDPRSTVNPAKLARTCGACHPGAGQRFAIGPVHVVPASRGENPVVRFIRRAYWVLIPVIIGFMFLHHALDFFRKFLKRERWIDPAEAAYRLNKHFRVAHWLVLISFPVLAITGFALKFPDSWWARPLLLWEGHFAVRATVHRIAAVVLLASIAYHAAQLIVDKRARRIMAQMVLHLEDLRDLQDMMIYNLGLSETRPVLGGFNYVAKLEYLAFGWGTMVMAVSGCMLWFNTLTLRYLPKWALDAATALHYYEAILATFAILIWHMYAVIFDPDVYPMDRVRARGIHPSAAGPLARTETADASLGPPAPDVHKDPTDSSGKDDVPAKSGPEGREPI
jgi:cytochrome b subunit of formate dehydrogenase